MEPGTEFNHSLLPKSKIMLKHLTLSQAFTLEIVSTGINLRLTSYPGTFHKSSPQPNGYSVMYRVDLSWLAKCLYNPPIVKECIVNVLVGNL